MQRSFKSIVTVDQFSPITEQLKSYFSNTFAQPLHASEDRFQWDYWHVPGQYTVVRTPANRFFGENLFESIQSELEGWGLKNLGCGEISPCWLSYYVEGCEQLLHADNPHGPWAFVLSLTDWKNRQFSGGETKLLSEQVLNYWQGFDSELGLEQASFIDTVEPLFNRLTVFDPRRPHGVETVRGEKDPRKARIVLHGWFLEPQPILSGGLEGEDLGDTLGGALNPALDEIESQGVFNGYVCYRFDIESSGKVSKLELLSNTLRSVDVSKITPQQVEKHLTDCLDGLQFPPAKESSELFFPLVFK